jgi:acylphosphatase
MPQAFKRRLGLLALMLLPAVGPIADAKSPQDTAISGTVTGNDQRVGFRAMVMKQAIQYNLAGSAKNNPNNIVEFTLQGDPARINAALKTIAEGTKKSSDIKVATSPATVAPSLDTFTVVDWTSTSRQITTPYTLVFHLRSQDGIVSKSDAKDAWHKILETTLKGDDLKKLGDDD